MDLILKRLKRDFCFDVNGRFGTTWMVTLYVCRRSLSNEWVGRVGAAGSRSKTICPLSFSVRIACILSPECVSHLSLNLLSCSCIPCVKLVGRRLMANYLLICKKGADCRCVTSLPSSYRRTALMDTGRFRQGKGLGKSYFITYGRNQAEAVINFACCQKMNYG